MKYVVQFPDVLPLHTMLLRGSNPPLICEVIQRAPSLYCVCPKYLGLFQACDSSARGCFSLTCHYSCVLLGVYERAFSHKS